MLVLFLVGISTRQMMHNVFANHKDGAKNISPDGSKTQITTHLIHCQCDNFVIESPFKNADNLSIVQFSHLYFQFTATIANTVFNKHYTCIQFRGPPAFSI